MKLIQRFTLFIALLLPLAGYTQTQYFLFSSQTDLLSGESTFAPLAGEKPVDVLSFSFGGFNAVSVNSFGIDVDGPQFQPLEFLIETDSKTLPQALRLLADNTVLNKVTLEGYTESLDGFAPILRIELENVVVASLTLEGTDGDRGVFTLSLEWGQITMTTWSIDSTTGDFTANPSVTFDRVKGILVED
ncbi:MAG: type VI secretion system tube protein Hcp [Verrucomicrobiota bacterium]